MLCCSGDACGGGGLLGAICCLIVIGPVLLIVGVIVLLSPNTRVERINEYNSAVDAFNGANGDYGRLRQFAGVVEPIATPMIPYEYTMATQNVDVGGNTDGVKQTTTIFAHATVQLAQEFRVNSSSFGPRFTSTRVPIVTSASIKLPCANDRRCSTDCSQASSRYCSYSNVAAYCQERYGFDATFVRATSATNSRCTGSEVCGTCSYVSYLRSVCFVIARSSSNAGAWIQDPSYQSCDYPFRAQRYEAVTKSQTIPFQMRANTDPWIVLQRLSQGTMDFGLTQSQQIALGIALIAIGGALTAAVIIPVCLKCQNETQSQVGAAQVNDGQAMNNVAVQQSYQPQQQQYEAQQPVQQQFQPQQPAYGYPPQPAGPGVVPYNPEPQPNPPFQTPQPHGAPPPQPQQWNWPAPQQQQHQQQQFV